MIEWKKYPENQPPSHSNFLIVVSGNVVQANHALRPIYGYAWEDMEGRLIFNVTHYAEINLPEAIVTNESA